MLIYYGWSLFGKVDTLSNGWSIQTKFFHIYKVPLIPLGTQVVVEQSGKSWRGIPYTFNGKSVGMAYLRGWSIVAAVALLVGVVLGVTEDRSDTVVVAGLMFGALAAIGLAALSWRWGRTASPTREEEILRYIAEYSAAKRASTGFDVVPVKTAAPPPLPVAYGKPPGQLPAANSINRPQPTPALEVLPVDLHSEAQEPAGTQTAELGIPASRHAPEPAAR